MADQDANPTVALIVRAVLTAGLLVFGFFSGDPSVTSLIIGAVVGYWLREGEGRARRRRRRRSGAGNPPANVDDEVVR